MTTYKRAVGADVNNSIPVSSVYPGVYATTGAQSASNQVAAAQAANTDSGPLGKPATWWLVFALIFVAFVWIARKYAGGPEAANFGSIRMSLYNGVFLAFYIVLILNLLKILAVKAKIPGVSELILAA